MMANDEHDHCVTCAHSIGAYEDGQWHHDLDTDDPEGAVTMMALERDHQAEPCATRCDVFALLNGGRDMHKIRGDAPWEVLVLDVLDVTERDDIDRAAHLHKLYRGRLSVL